jgi:membrane associated rhomboid family serine protease
MLLPLGDRDTKTGFPVVTAGIIAVTVLAFLYQLGHPDVTFGYSVVPLEITTGRDIIGTATVQLQDGITVRIPETAGPSPIWLTLISATFLHGGWIHLLGNMWFLLIFGDNVERAWGWLRYLGFYVIAGICASLAHVAVSSGSTVPSLGASGAISGVIAAYFVMFPGNYLRIVNPLMGISVLLPFAIDAQERQIESFAGVDTSELHKDDRNDPLTRSTWDVPALVFIGAWALLQFAEGIASIGDVAQTTGVAYFAHIGGFVVGIVFGALWMPADSDSLFSLRAWRKAIADDGRPARNNDAQLDAAWFAARLKAEPTLHDLVDLHVEMVAFYGPESVRHAWMRLPDPVLRQLTGLRVREVIARFG